MTNSQTATLNTKISKGNRIKIYVWIISFLRKYKVSLFLLILCSSVIVFAEISIPKFIQYFIDKVIVSKDTLTFNYMLVALICLIIITLIASMGKEIFQRSIQEKASKELIFSLFNQLRRLGFSYYEKNPVGVTLGLFNTEVTSVQQIYRKYLPDIIQKSILAICTSTLIAQMNPNVVLISLPFFIIYFVSVPFFARKAAIWGKKAQDERMETNKKLYDSIVSMLEIRAFGAQQWGINKLVHSFQDLHYSITVQRDFAYLRGTVYRLSVYAGAIFVFSYGIFQVKSGSMSIGEFVAFQLYYFLFMFQVMDLMILIIDQQIVLQQAEKLYAFVKQSPDVMESSAPVFLPNIRGDIQFQKVTFGYNASRVLNEFDLHIKPGEKVALVGGSGNGKSTVLKLVGRFYDPLEGNIKLDGVSIKDLSFEQLRGAIGIVFQESYLYGFSVMDNIRFGNPNASDEQVKLAAKAAYANDFIESLPEGYNTLLGERGSKLSGGQKQRIAIARMFLKDPTIVLLDEATSALDSSSELEVQKAFDALLKGRTTITVAHRISTVKHYDRIVLIDEGKNFEAGTYDELMSRKERFYLLVDGEKATEKAGERE